MAAAVIAVLEHLLRRINGAEGHDQDLDRAIARDLEGLPDVDDAAAYTASVDRCLDLLHRLLPGWHWHLGYGATGVMPYAFVSRGGYRFEATAPTVPLALLRAVTQAALALERDRS
jgi:hypothetical protein